MRKYFSYILFLVASSTFLYTFFLSNMFSGGASFQVKALKEQLQMQQAEREREAERVAELRHLLVGIQTDPDVLEKVAREELRMMGQNEEIVIFRKRQGLSNSQ
ncbi:MAG: septum formation initiator family protein [Bdellovibrionales bacterium]|nr:septum formation initiator family protein [Bdellovibrionales bacterium]